MFVAYLQRIANKILLQIETYTFPQDNGVLGGRDPNLFTIEGDQLSAFAFTGVARCYVEFGPTSKLTFDGTMACPNWPKLAITASAF